MNRYVALVLSLVSLLVAAALFYLSYRLVAWGLAGDFRDLWTGGIYALVVGYLGCYPLAAAVVAMFTAKTGPVTSAPKNTGTARKIRTNGYAGVEIDDGGDWDD